MKYFSIMLLLFLATQSFSQEKRLSVVWDLSSTDTSEQAAVFRQINNALALVPDMQIEVVFHGPAVYAMMKDSLQFASRIKAATQKGVTLAVCNNSLRRLKIDPTQIVSEGIVVPSAVVELIRKQSEGWSYLKAAH